MSEEFEAAGAAIEGGLLAKAVEGEAGDTIASEPGACLNCKAPVTGNYCGNCGQSLHVHRSIGAFWHDILHGVLHFEGKFWRTIPLLAWKPGELTRRYVQGERARFISPMALFLFSIFMMFAVFSLSGGPFSSSEDGAGDQNMNVTFLTDGDELDDEIIEKTARLPNATDEQKETLEAQIFVLKTQRNMIASMTGAEQPYPDAKINSGTPKAFQISPAEMEELDSGWDEIKDGRALTEGSSITTGAPKVDKWFRDAFKKIDANPDLLFYKLKANGYKFAWLLIPISLPFVWLTLLGRRGFRFYDHAVFATYSLSFMSLLFIFCAILAAVGVTEPVWVLLLIFYPPFHMYRQLRHAYSMTRHEAFVRTSFLLLFTVISLTLFFAILLALGVLG